MLELFFISYPLMLIIVGMQYGTLLRSGRWRFALVLLGITVAWGMCLIPYTIYGFSEAVNPSPIIQLMSVIAAPMIIIALFQYRSALAKLADGQRLRRLFWTGMVVLLLCLSAPFVSVFGVERPCDAQNYATGATIQAALQTFYDELGEYPPDVDSLVPDYLAEVPALTCFAPHGWAIFGVDEVLSQARYAIERCGVRETVLVWPSLTGAHIERINLATGNGSGVMARYGTCADLP